MQDPWEHRPLGTEGVRGRGISAITEPSREKRFLHLMEGKLVFSQRSLPGATGSFPSPAGSPVPKLARATCRDAQQGARWPDLEEVTYARKLGLDFGGECIPAGY